MMQLKLQAVQAGVTSLWEVTLYPAAGQGGPPQWVVVPGRDSRQATAAAFRAESWLCRRPGAAELPDRHSVRADLLKVCDSCELDVRLGQTSYSG